MSGQARPEAGQLRLDFDALSRFLDDAFPASARPAFGRLTGLREGHVQVRLEPTAAMVRPGNIVSGPVLMGMADFAAYAVVLAHVGPVAMAVTSNLTIAFLRAARLEPVVADASLLKLGRTTTVVDVRLWQQEEARPVAQATVSYVLP